MHALKWISQSSSILNTYEIMHFSKRDVSCHRHLRCRRQLSSISASSVKEIHPLASRRDMNMLLITMGGVHLATPDFAWAKTRAGLGPSAGDWSSPGLNVPLDPSIPEFFKTSSGVKVQELVVGNGDAAQKGDRVLFDYVLRRNNEYFIYSTIEGVSFQPRDTPVGPVAVRLGDTSLISGLNETLLNMKKGSKRRVLIPPSTGYAPEGKYDETLQPQPPTFATKRQLSSHSTEPLLFEIELLRITR